MTWSTATAILILLMGSADFRTRERATMALQAAGEPAIPHLVAAEQSEDAEIAQRAYWIVDEHLLALAKRGELLPAGWIGLPSVHYCDLPDVQWSNYRWFAAEQLKATTYPEYEADAVYRFATVFLCRDLAANHFSGHDLRDMLDAMAAAEIKECRRFDLPCLGLPRRQRWIEPSGRQPR